ncbi:MAG TPA: GTP cyclohydrolase II [Polyangia bacterium]|jgi:GTP cyclohydrolase II
MGDHPSVTRYASATLPTKHGTFRVDVFRDPAGLEHTAVRIGDVSGAEVLCRVHSECWTSEVLGSLKCDCRVQLDSALERIAREGRGVLIYLRQEGRGIGLGDKIRAYALQEQGADTVDANVRLGLPVDGRRYDVAAAMLADLGVASVVLMTNNPDKIAGLAQAGMPVVRRVAHWLPSSLHSARYLETKRSRLGHLGLEAESDESEAAEAAPALAVGALAPASIRRPSGGDERTRATWRR